MIKKFACNAGGAGLIPGSGRSPGEGHGIPLQYSCQENPMDREAWQATHTTEATVQASTRQGFACFSGL